LAASFGSSSTISRRAPAGILCLGLGLVRWRSGFQP
jgi:hypothetical protein